VFAVTQLTGDDEGGADSPEELGNEFMAALEDEDVLGLVDLLLPGERELVREPLETLVHDLARLDVLSDDATLADVAGLDIEIEGESVSVEATNVDDIANVSLDGEITATVDGQSLPLGEVVVEQAGDANVAALDATDTTPLGVRFAAVEEDGRWYVSMFFTIAEQARTSSTGELPPIPQAGIEPIGGATPEDAIDNVLDGVEDLDLQQIIGALNPGEAAALQRYAPLFLDDANAQLTTVPLTLDVTDAEYTVTGDGDRRHAVVDVLAMEGDLDGEAFEMEFVDGCARVTVGDTTQDSCELADAGTTGSGEAVVDMFEDPAVQEFLGVLEDVFGDLELPGLTLVRADGEWYISPLGTVFDQLLAVTGAVDRDELDQLIATGPPALDALGAWLFGATGPVVVDGEPEPVPGSVPPATVAGADPTSQCYELADGEAAAACFQTLIAAGTVDPATLPAELGHPECGVAAAYWEGYGLLGDEEFFALVDAARPCFLDLVARGEIEEWQLGYEYTKPECFEGRNWYAVFDDPAYDERFTACVGA
jgi:hypothetical protein